MKTENDISEELKSMGSVLAGMSRKMPYSVPSGYFEDFSGRLNERITELDGAEPVPQWGKELPYSVPAGYFEGLAGQVMNAAKMDDSERVNTSLPKSVPFTVPAGYFDKLPDQFLQAAKATETQKQVPLRRINIYRRIVWAAAAVLLLAAGVTTYKVFFDPATNDELILASVSNNDIRDYVQGTYRFDVDRVVGNPGMNDMQMENKDIVQYLDETGWDVVE